jgi:PIN domain nuclease of toxin-antitoxin system
MIIEPLYVTDTHALHWFLTGNSKLSRSALAIFKAANRAETQIAISAISVAELYWVNKKWKDLPDFTATYQILKNSSEFLLVPLEADDVLDFDRDATIPEMHDRIIVGLARRLNAPLLTSDSAITESGIVRIVW